MCMCVCVCVDIVRLSFFECAHVKRHNLCYAGAQITNEILFHERVRKGVNLDFLTIENLNAIR